MTRRLRWAVVAVALLALLAGCNVFASSQDSPVTETVTPVPVPSVTDSAAMSRPETATVGSGLGAFLGVSAAGGIDVEVLLETHVSVLSTKSYTVEWARRTAGGTGPVSQRFERRVEVAGDDTYLRRDEGIRTGNVTTTYVDSEVGYRRVVDDMGVTVDPVSVRPEGAARERFARLVSFEVRTFFADGYDDLTVVERDGRPYARVFTTRAPPLLAQIYDAYTLTNFTATMWIAPEGYVQAVHYEFDLVDVETTIPVEWRYSYTEIGETTVDRPQWVPENATDSSRENGTDRTPSGTATDRSATPTRTPDPARVPPSTASNATATR